MLKVLFWIFIGPYYLAFKLFTFPISLILKLFVLYGHNKPNFSNNSQSSKKFKYANKTCNNCGLQKPANMMFRTIKTVKSGKSNTGLTYRTLFGALIGNKSSGRQFAKWALFPNKRVYTRNRHVWVCSKSCAKALR